MKLPLLVTLALAVCCGSCDLAQKETPVESTASFVASQDQLTSEYTPLYIHNIPSEDRINTSSTRYGAYGQFIVPPMQQFEPQVLVKNIWTFEYYVDNLASRLQKQAGTGQWLQFRPDGSFVGGHWERQTHSGAWYMDYQYEHPRLTLDSNVDLLDAIWEIQGVNGNQDAMSWVRPTDTNFGPKRKSIKCKLIETIDRPTKEQFANLYRN